LDSYTTIGEFAEVDKAIFQNAKTEIDIRFKNYVHGRNGLAQAFQKGGVSTNMGTKKKPNRVKIDPPCQ
jgi:hypothetical protein